MKIWFNNYSRKYDNSIKQYVGCWFYIPYQSFAQFWKYDDELKHLCVLRMYIISIKILKERRKRKRADIRISKRNYHRIEINEEHCWKARSLLFLDLIEIIFRKCFMLKSFFFILRDWVHVTGQLAINIYIYIYIWLFGPIKLLGLYILEVIL